uniref:Uncharacterized protein n=1 Tax=Balaenoptera musculus TaxID=9771 RepID=A0A8C0CZC4_BALMU
MEKPFLHLHRRLPSPTAQQSREATAGAEASPAHSRGGNQGWGRSGRQVVGPLHQAQEGVKDGPACWEETDLGTMETQRASLALGRWPLWLLLGLVVPSASAQALSYREAVLRAVDRLNEQSSEANLYRLLELDPPPKADEDPDTPKPVSFTVKETVCPRTSQQPPEQCDFKENGLVKQCVGTVTLDQERSCVTPGSIPTSILVLPRSQVQSVGRFSRLLKRIRKVWRKIGPIAGPIIGHFG